ncbi:MAG: metallophosphoesterase family protein [bacterium]|nr:metallophosphoesterase family protein [bacterium]
MSFLKEISKPAGRIFAIGDIHGCAKETEVLLHWLQFEEELSQSDLVVFIGDYIDRGTNSKDVINLLIQFKQKFPQTIFLKGNHEDMLLAYLGLGGGNGEVYIKNGGGMTFLSYGLPVETPAKEVLSTIPENHINFFKSLESLVVCGEHIFVHAGLNPKKTLKRQVSEDLYWIREGFLDQRHHFSKVVVFGHTPHAEVIFDLPLKIGIDTGLVYGNMLSCIELTNMTLYQVLSKSKEVMVSDFPQ